MENLNGKRLLILGGTSWINAIDDFAKDNGITIIGASNDPNAKFFEIAQESYVISSTDAEAMKKLIREKKIDGVHMAGNENVMAIACKYINETGLPCYCSSEQLKILHNKKSFKKLCISVDLPVVPEIEVDPKKLEESARDLIYPVITKPVDGAGSRGFSICRNGDDFLSGYKIAYENSSSGDVIVEPLVDNSSAYVFYTLSEGKPYFSGFTKRYPVQYKKQGSYILGVILFKSPYTEEFRQLFENKLINLFDKMQMREGNLFIETFHDGKTYYFNEMGYRYPGTSAFYPIDYFYGINQLHSDIYYSLTGKSCLKGHKSLIPDSVPRKKHYAIYAIHLKPGEIHSINGIDELKKRKNMVLFSQAKFVGQIVEDTGTFAQIFALVHFVFDSKEELRATVDYIHKIIIVKNERGENLVNRMLDIEKTEDFFRAHEKL